MRIIVSARPCGRDPEHDPAGSGRGRLASGPAYSSSCGGRRHEFPAVELGKHDVRGRLSRIPRFRPLKKAIFTVCGLCIDPRNLLRGGAWGQGRGGGSGFVFDNPRFASQGGPRSLRGWAVSLPTRHGQTQVDSVRGPPARQCTG